MKTVVAVWLTRLTVAVLIAVGTCVGVAGSASAHDVLISSDPADGSTVKAVPSAISFTFDQPVQNFDPVVSLVGPDGKQYASGAPQISGNVVTGTVSPGPPGAYTAAYRIVSADGHPVTGEIHFTIPAGAPAGSAGASAVSSGAVAAQPTSVATSPAPAASSSTAGRGGLSAGIWIGLVIAALVIAAAAVILLRRPTGGPADGSPADDKDY